MGTFLQFLQFDFQHLHMVPYLVFESFLELLFSLTDIFLRLFVEQCHLSARF